MKFPGLELEPLQDSVVLSHDLSKREKIENLLNVKLPNFFNDDGSTYVPGTARTSEWELNRVIYSPYYDKFFFSYHQTREGESKFDDEALSIVGNEYEVVKNFINYHRLHNVLPDKIAEWLWIRINKRHVPDWNDLMFELQKEIKLTKQDCEYLETDEKRSDLLKKSSDLGLI